MAFSQVSVLWNTLILDFDMIALFIFEKVDINYLFYLHLLQLITQWETLEIYFS